MPSNNKLLIAAVGLGMIAGSAAAQTGRGDLERLPPASMDGRMAGGDRDPALPPDGSAVTQDKVSYDEVGYASWYGPDRAGMPLPNGEIFEASGVSAAHASLPVPSYAEVTNLKSGRTILVRINDNGPPPKGQLVVLSLGAARQLGVEIDGLFPVRVRRTNPPEFERVALQGGGVATERLETPPALLNALRKKLGSAPATTAVLRTGPAKPVVKPAPKTPAPSAAPPPLAETPQVVAAVSNGRFIEEEARPHWKTGVMAKAKPTAAASRPVQPLPVPVARTGGSLYLQVAAFSNEARARAAAARVGGSVSRAGTIYRVRSGPYANDAAARAAVGAMAAKGYPGARVTR